MPFARRRGALFAIGAVLLLVSGCAAPGSRIADNARDGASTPRVSRELIGTWHGTYGQIGMVYYEDDADCTLQIKDVVTKGERVVPRTASTA